MNNLYRKIAVTSVGIALGFCLGADKEAKAATIILTPTTSFGVTDEDGDWVGDNYYVGVPFPVRRDPPPNYFSDSRAFYEFNIANLSLPSNTVISRVDFEVKADFFGSYHRSFAVNLGGYRGNGQPDTSDFEAAPDGRGLVYRNMGLPQERFNFYFSFGVDSFVNELINQNAVFAGFWVSAANNQGYMTLNPTDASLIITTADIPEPVPEPATILGSVIGLCLGGWLKRKNSNWQNKTMQ
jgi:hypothetical protein